MVFVMAVLVGSASAQLDSSTYNSAREGLMIEITASPLSRDFSSSRALLSFGQFRARYFLNENIVPRLGIHYSVNNNNSGSTKPTQVMTVLNYAFTPGVEYHFLNEGSFTSYAALDVLISGRVAKMEDNQKGSVSGVSTTSIPSQPNQAFNFSSRGYSGFGAYGAVGADYHFSSRFYAGAEIGFYFMMGSTSDITLDGTLYQEGAKFFQSGVRTSNSLRIGFKLF